VKIFTYAICVIALVALAACGGGGSSDISVTITPAAANVAISSTQQFTANVTGTSNNGVTWEVNGVSGGDEKHGTITSAGLYTAPDTIPSPSTVTITAVSNANTNKTAQASIVIGDPVTVSPSTASVAASATQQFSASVIFSTTNTAVTWQVNGVEGGNSTVGTINKDGLYTAPNTVPSPNTVTVTAVAKADSSRKGTATITVTPPPIVISPSNAVIAAGAQQTFSATVLSNTAHPVWNVTCASTTAGACGIINTDGVYTAPAMLPPHGSVTITASMADQTAATRSVTATLQFGKATLAGTYIFALTDRIGNKGPSQVGAMVLNGAGQITGGVLDSSDTPGTPQSVTGGSYTVGTDGRGTATVQTSTGVLNLQLVIAGRNRGFAVRTDAGANQAAGTIELQQTAAQVLNGGYTISTSGWTAGSSPALQVEAGSISVNGAGAVTSGVIDTNQALALQTTAVTGGAVSQPSDGYRGTVSIQTASGTQTFAYYPVDGQHAKVIAIDGTLTSTGELYQQAQGSVTSSSLKGSYVFSANGAKSTTPYGVVGKFSLDGTGGVSSLVFDGIAQTVFDSNSGAYTVTDAQTGRTTATWSGNGTTLQYVLYPRSDGGMVMLQCDGIYAGIGEALQRADTWKYNLSSKYDAYALYIGGSEVSTSSTPERITGQMAFSTTTALSGAVDGTSKGQGTTLTLNLQNQDLNSQRYQLGIHQKGLPEVPSFFIESMMIAPS
jgi:hypothetical protein